MTPFLLLLANVWFDKTIPDPPHLQGEPAKGERQIEIPARQRYFVEVFVSVKDDGKYDFRLMNGSATVDERPGWKKPNRLRPRNPLRRITMMGWVEAPAQLRLQTEAPEYVFHGHRLTRARDFASVYRPLWHERLRYLTTHAIFEGQEGGPMARQRYILQLSERLRHAAQPEIRNEALLGMTRAYYWVAAENHEPSELARTEELLRECLRAMPEDSIVRQMATASCAQTNSSAHMPRGDFCEQVKPVPWPLDLAAPLEGAPDWAAVQRKLRKRMETITRWWVEQRQQPNGELGGGWGDDVEILRAWGPLAVGLGSPVAAKGIERIANGIWKSGQIVDGYDKDMRDVEHSSEPTTDTQPMLAALNPENPEALAHLKATAACAPNWILRQPDGMYRFQSSWFNCKEHDPAPNRAVDVHLNVRAMGPALWYASLTRDDKLTQLIVRWAESWLAAMNKTEHGKPADRIPPAMWAKNGSYLINSNRWDKPDAEWDYFQWSERSEEAVLSLFRAAFDFTRDPKWTEAIQRATTPTRKEEAVDPRVLAAELERKLSVNFDMNTSEALYTDRVYYAPPEPYARLLFGGDPPRGERYPAFAVTWVPSERDYAREVVEASETTLSLQLYNFDERPAIAEFWAWRLKPGKYRWSCQSGDVEVVKAPQRLRIGLPPRRETACELRP